MILDREFCASLGCNPQIAEAGRREWARVMNYLVLVYCAKR